MTQRISFLAVLVALILVSSCSAWSSQARTTKGGLFATSSTSTSDASSATTESMFDEFVKFLQDRQSSIIQELEQVEASYGSTATFSRDAWGLYDEASSSANMDEAAGNNNKSQKTSGGLTRVLQGGQVIEKGACSLTVIQQGRLTAERAAALRSRMDESNNHKISAGDLYSAAALSMVLHAAHPHVPTFRSDVRLFWVRPSIVSDDNNNDNNNAMAWLGGGADLTPNYLYEDDICFFHGLYKDLCTGKLPEEPGFGYADMKQACDDYFFLPARSEHRGTGGVFFDDLPLHDKSWRFCQGLVDTWMPSWLPIVKKRQGQSFTDAERQWQLLRRGRYLEFNLLYDRGVKFGLGQANPRVEGVMVSAPPLIAYEYCHAVPPGSREAEMMQVLKEPRNWV